MKIVTFTDYSKLPLSKVKVVTKQNYAHTISTDRGF